MLWGLLTAIAGLFSVVNGDGQFDIFTRSKMSVDGFVDTVSCYAAMEDSISDQSGDRKMNQEDYANFVKSYGPDGFLEDISTFEELPLILKSTFYYIACLCKTDSIDESCCVGSNAGIETDGSFSGETPTVAEQSYLFLVCSQTSTSIDRVIQSTPPSEAPIVPSAPTASPTPEIITPTFIGIGTMSPTMNSGNGTTQEEVLVTYSIGIRGEAIFKNYSENLISAMGSLAPEILQDVQGRRLRVGRRLQSVQLPTSITNHTSVDCPPEINSTENRCENITASVILLFQPTETNPSEVAVAFRASLLQAIWQGLLQNFLESSAIFILDENVTGGNDNEEGDGAQGRNISLALIGSLVLVGAIAFFVTRRKDERKEGLEEFRPIPINHITLDSDPREATVGARSIVKDVSPTTDKKILDCDNAIQTKPKSVDGFNNLSIADDMSNLDNGDASSSNAGSSGWSSSAGIDSMNTSSADGLDFDKSPITVIGSTSPIQDEKCMNMNDAHNTSPVTRDDLDTAIEAGDWAAVGATAALLAATSDSQSYSSKSEQYTGTRSRSGSSVSSLDVARAAELDHLVDAGDWEGVVLAAAKYEGDEGKESLPSASISGSESRSNADTAGQTADSSIASSKATKQQEYRAIVEDLVQRVVPEEIQNVDEMMLQFRGREDELVETLRTMQERAVAQKARHSSQKAAKQQAKLSSVASKIDSESGVSVKRSKSIGTGKISAVLTAKSLGTGEIESARKSVNRKKIEESEDPSKQTALEAAIEAGDWNAVGEAAALLTDASIASSANTNDIDLCLDGVSIDGSSADESSNIAEVADELEELIEAGDWTGVVQAASGKGASSSGKKSESAETRRLRRLKHLQEEQEALAQAEIWSAIAEQSKQEAETTDQGAVDAAEWAIGRSLNALVEAELSGINDQSTVGTDGESLSQGRKKDDDESGNEV